MNRLAVAASISCVLWATPAVLAQQKLGDVAGSIKLKKTGTEPVVIDSAELRPSSAGSGSRSGFGNLYDVLVDCLDVSRSLETMVADAPRIRPARYSEEWKTQLADIGVRLDSLNMELQMQPNAGAGEAAYLKAAGGFDQVVQGYQEIVVATERGDVLRSAQKRAISTGADTIDAAMGELRSVSRTQAKSAPPPPIDPIAAASSIRSLCSAYGAEGSGAYTECANRQEAAKNALIGRTGPAVGVDTTTFNNIRNGCRFEWPNNFVNWNACEVRRAAAASGS